MNNNKLKLDVLKKGKNADVEIDTRTAAEVMIDDAVKNNDMKVVKVHSDEVGLKNVIVEESNNNDVSETEPKKKSNRGRKATRPDSMVKFSYKVPKSLADTVKATLLRKGKKVQPVMTKLIEEWIKDPRELNIDEAYLGIMARDMKSTGFFMEQATINEFGAVVTENDTSMNLVVIYLYNEIVRGNY